MLDKIKGFATIIFVLTIMVLGGYTKTKEMEKANFETYKLVDEIHKTMEKMYFAQDFMTLKTLNCVYQNSDRHSDDLQIFDVVDGYSVDHEYGEIMINWSIMLIDENDNVNYVNLNCHKRENVKYILWWYRSILSPNYLYMD